MTDCDLAYEQRLVDANPTYCDLDTDFMLLDLDADGAAEEFHLGIIRARGVCRLARKADWPGDRVGVRTVGQCWYMSGIGCAA